MMNKSYFFYNKKDKRYQKILKIIFYIFLFLFVISFFSANSVREFITSVLGLVFWWIVLIFLPIKLSKKKGKKGKKVNKKTIGLYIGLIVILLIAILIFTPGNDTQENTGEIEELDLSGLGPDEVTELYVSYLSYGDLTERIYNLKHQEQILTDSYLEDITSMEQAYSLLDSLISANFEKCEVIKQAGNDFCLKLEQPIFMRVRNSFNASFTNLGVEILEEIDTNAEVKIFHEKIYMGNDLGIGETVYLLKKEEGIWKVYDYRGIDGFSSEDYDMELYIEVVNNLTDIMRTNYNALERIAGIIQFKNSITSRIYSVIPSSRIINIELASYNNESDRYIVDITYYFEDEFLMENYLNVMRDSSELFEEVFPVDSKIYQVRTIVKEKTKDDYGNDQERYLARTSMNRETYDRINWDGFEFTDLDSITDVSYYGDSWYRDLRDISDPYDNWDPGNYGGFSIIGDMGFDLCEDAEIQCTTYGECDTLEILESQGMC
jgi:hypothetical protein